MRTVEILLVNIPSLQKAPSKDGLNICVIGALVARLRRKVVEFLVQASAQSLLCYGRSWCGNDIESTSVPPRQNLNPDLTHVIHVETYVNFDAEACAPKLFLELRRVFHLIYKNTPLIQ